MDKVYSSGHTDEWCDGKNHHVFTGSRFGTAAIATLDRPSNDTLVFQKPCWCKELPDDRN